MSNTETETVKTNTDTDTEIDLNNLSDEEFLKYYDDKINSINTSKPVETNDNVDTKQKEDIKDIKEESNTDISTSNDTDNEDNIKEEDNTNSDNTINYKEEYEKIFKGFKANGKELKPTNVDEVISLMQKGANYNKKMKDIKHMTKQVKSLTDAGIQDLETLNYIIDIYKGDKEAIKKLLKDKNIDTYDLDLEDIQYKNNYNNILSDDSVKFSMAIDEIKESPNRDKIYSIIQNEWDSTSKNELLKDTNLIKGLQYEVESGRYDIIQEEVNRLKQFGQFEDVSDLTAYQIVLNNYLVKQGVIDSQGNVINKPNTSNNKKIKDIDVNKESIKPTTHTNNTKSDKYSDEDIKKMSDEEFIKRYDNGEFFN